ncbi:hypothetical protein PFISCL1PPCAC_2992, partial [Pristionchus fissidentatus]
LDNDPHSKLTFDLASNAWIYSYQDWQVKLVSASCAVEQKESANTCPCVELPIPSSLIAPERAIPGRTGPCRPGLSLRVIWAKYDLTSIFSLSEPTTRTAIY